MAFVVEDGTGLANADSYVSVADADTYVGEHLRAANADRVAWLAASNANKEIALRQATDWLDVTFRERWKGRRINETMSLAWPRFGATDEDGYTLDSDAVPQVVKDACAEMAARGVGEDLFVDNASPSGAVKRTKDKVGPLETEVEYAGAATQGVEYVKADTMLRGVLESSGANLHVERA
jgi:hypothetical protein